MFRFENWNRLSITSNRIGNHQLRIWLSTGGEWWFVTERTDG